MITSQVQVRLNLPVALKEYLDSKARKFGMPVAGYVKHLILKDVSDMDYPIFQMSEASEEKATKALKEKAHAVEITDVDDYFNS